MLKVTEKAAQVLVDMLKEKGESEEDCLRLVSQDGENFVIGVGKLKEGDQVVNYNGKRVLIIDGILASHLANVTVGVKDAEAGPEIVIFKEAAA